jgi:hypothetical protein
MFILQLNFIIFLYFNFIFCLLLYLFLIYYSLFFLFCFIFFISSFKRTCICFWRLAFAIIFTRFILFLSNTITKCRCISHSKFLKFWRGIFLALWCIYIYLKLIILDRDYFKVIYIIFLNILITFIYTFLNVWRFGFIRWFIKKFLALLLWNRRLINYIFLSTKRFKIWILIGNFLL